MRVDKLRVVNFRSFQDQAIHLNPFSVLIGANSSGKSNLVQVFKFLRDADELGISEAVSIQGDMDFLLSLGASKPELLIQTESSERAELFAIFRQEDYSFYNLSTTYSLKIKNGIEGRLLNEQKITVRFEAVNQMQEVLGTGSLHVSLSRKGALKADLSFEEGTTESISRAFDTFRKLFDSRSPFYGDMTDRILRIPFLSIQPVLDFSAIGIYDIDPKLAKESSQVNVRNELEENGSNFTKSLKNVIDDPLKRQVFTSTLRDLLPQLSNFNVEKTVDRSLISKFNEIYFKDKFLPSFLMSDGAIYLSSLILALQFNKDKHIVIIEEPEKYIHPALIEKLVDYLTQYSRDKQIIITSHSREVVRSADPESLLMIKRDGHGYTVVEKVSTMKGIIEFLSEEVGIDDLFSQGLLS